MKGTSEITIPLPLGFLLNWFIWVSFPYLRLSMGNSTGREGLVMEGFRNNDHEIMDRVYA